jgi:hypothetical protein
MPNWGQTSMPINSQTTPPRQSIDGDVAERVSEERANLSTSARRFRCDSVIFRWRDGLLISAHTFAAASNSSWRCA